jgi:hypothetical protein
VEKKKKKKKKKKIYVFVSCFVCELFSMKQVKVKFSEVNWIQREVQRVMIVL